MEKISIIIPCRNEEEYIKDFLESVLSNDYPKEYMEILIIDGKSLDNTLWRLFFSKLETVFFNLKAKVFGLGE